MGEFYPILAIGAAVGLLSLVFLVLYVRLVNSGSKDFVRYMSDREVAGRLLAYAKPYKKDFCIALVCLLLSIAYDLAVPLVVGHVEKIVVGQFEMSRLLSIVALYAGILLVSMACTYIQSLILQKVGQKILSQIRMDLFTHIESLSHEQLNSTPVGKFVTRVTNDSKAISYMFTNVLVTMLKNITSIFGVLCAMLILNWTLTLVVLCFVPFLVLFTLLFRRFSRTAHRNVSDATTELNTFLSENLSGIRITQAFNRQEQKNQAFRSRSRALQKAKLGRMMVFGVFRPTVYLLHISAVLFLLYFSARGYIRQTEVLGQVISGSLVVSFYMYIARFFNPIGVLAEQIDMLQKSFASAEKIFTIMDMKPQVVDLPDAMDLEEIRGEIEFRDVWFAYEPDQWVLKGVSFRVEAGQTVAFVGATGSGKTTILSLLCRNYDIQKGQILLDGIDIRNIKIASLRRHFGQMLQDVFLFSGTIRSNILLGLQDVSEEKIWEAVRYVNAESFIRKLGNGLDEEVRERGNNFSAGQRQLISFARTVLHKPDVMILDEATANIDRETEILIQDSLEKMKNIGTMLVVAHRLSTIRNADNIIVLSQGQILEQGDHGQLLARQGHYYRLHRLQQEKLALESGEE